MAHRPLSEFERRNENTSIFFASWRDGCCDNASLCNCSPCRRLDCDDQRGNSATIIGSTLSGKTAEGESYSEYYAGDGTIRGAATSGRYVGTWWVRDDNTMCFKYGDGRFDAGCVYLSLTNDIVNFVRIDGTTEEPATLLRGQSEEAIERTAPEAPEL